MKPEASDYFRVFIICEAEITISYIMSNIMQNFVQSRFFASC